MRYLISGEKKGEWSFQPKKIAGNIELFFPEALVESVSSSSSHFEFSFSIPIWNLSGDLHKTGEFIGVEGDIENCILFAQWIYEQTNPELDLLIYDQGFNVHATFNSSTDIRLLTQALSK